MMKSSKNWIVLITACLYISLGNAFIVPRPSAGFSVTTSLKAKKKKKKKGSTAGQGFSQAPPPPAPKAPTEQSSSSTVAKSDSSTPAPLQSVETGGSRAIPVMQPEPELDPNLPPEERTKVLLREKYGLRTREEQDREQKKEEKRKEQQRRQRKLEKLAEEDKDVDIISMLPAPVLIAIDRFLKVGVAVSTVTFVAAGIAITAEAWAKASNNPLPQDIDNFIINVVEPNFTPGLGVLLAFSVSLGAFAALQLASDSSQYKEDN